MSGIAILSTICSIGLLGFIIERTLKKKIREQYALIWLALGVLLLVFSACRRLLDFAAHLAGIQYAPSLLILLVIFFGMILGVHFTLVISRLVESNKILAQEIGLLKNRMDRLEKSH